MLKQWLGALGRSLRDWKTLLWPCVSFFLVFYPEARKDLGASLGIEMPEIPRALLVITALLIVISFAFWHRVVSLEGRLFPKLSLEFDPNNKGCLHRTLLGGKVDVLFVRVLPTCESRITNCVGYLSSVYRFSGGAWEKTDFDERLDLTWANRGNANPIPIHNGVPQYLDVFCVPSTTNQIAICTASNQIPIRAASVFESGRIFKIDVGVMGDDNAFAAISLKVERGETWDKNIVTLLEQIPGGHPNSPTCGHPKFPHPERF
jgi:hypothetical protein